MGYNVQPEKNQSVTKLLVCSKCEQVKSISAIHVRVIFLGADKSLESQQSWGVGGGGAL